MGVSINPKISVVITCFNLGKYIDEAVSSVETQTINDWEIIIVDDGSTEPSTVECLKKIEKQGKHKIIRQVNTGLAGAKNNGIKNSRGKYIVCLDADDILSSEYLEKTLLALEQSDEEVAIATTWLQEFGLRKDLWKPPKYRVEEILINNVLHAASLFKKEIWEEIGGFKKMNIGGYEDWEFWLSAVDRGYKWDVVNEPLFYYRIRGNSMLAGAREEHTEIYKEIIQMHPKLFQANSSSLIIRGAEEMRRLHYAISEKNKAINDLKKNEDEVLRLRKQVFRLRDELHSIKNSRVLGKIIKFREFVGTTRHSISGIPGKTVHKTRVIVAPLVPGPARRFIKRLLKRLLYPRVSNTTPKVIIVANERWQSSHPLVSVIVPYYNRADTIDDTIASLKIQSFKNFEVIIVDDGSTDQFSKEKLKKLDTKGLNTLLMHQKNAGVSAARNNGINRAKGKYIICLDSDDMLASDFIEKCTIILETDPGVDFVTTNRQDFGVINEHWQNIEFDPQAIIKNNMIITAAEFKKAAWEKSGGYKTGIGYEDWEFWVNLTEKNFWGKLLAEPLFFYRTSIQSRYVEDKDAHWSNIKNLRILHPQFSKNVKKHITSRRNTKKIIKPETAFINMSNSRHYKLLANKKKNILIILPWMTFGGAETLIINFCKEIKNDFNLSFVTGLESEHEWGYKFKHITNHIYHLRNLFDSTELDLEFISNYIATRNIDILHIIHTSFAFEMLPEIKRRYPKLKTSVTVFNDRSEHFGNSVKTQDCIDSFSTDNKAVSDHYKALLADDKKVTTIPNGIDSISIYNPALYDRHLERKALGIGKEDVAVFFIGRLSEEKNPDVFVNVAKDVIHNHRKNVKFYIIGDGAMGRDIAKEVKSINHPNVQYLGYKAEVANYLAAADIFVLPSSIEGFPLSILEAMAMRVAVIASDVGAVSDVINLGQDGFIVKPGSADEIKDKILELANDKELMKQIKFQARRKIEKTYSNTILGRNYRQMFNELAK